MEKRSLIHKIDFLWNGLDKTLGLIVLALVAIILGVQLFLAGFIGELLITNSDKTTNYQIKEEIS